MAKKTTPAEGMRRCSGSRTFGFEAHEAPIADFPVQPSRKDGLGTMCRTHWRAYTSALGKARRLKKRADALVSTIEAEAPKAAKSKKGAPAEAGAPGDPTHAHRFVGTKEWFLHPGHMDTISVCACGAFGDATCPACFSSDADECSTARERSVAGTDTPVPPCPIHGDFLEAGESPAPKARRAKLEAKLAEVGVGSDEGQRVLAEAASA